MNKSAEENVNDELLGRIAVGLGLLTAAQAATALSSRQEEDAEEPGQVFVRSGVLDDEQVAYLFTALRMKAVRGADRRFGDLVLEQQWATPEEVAELLRVQKLVFAKRHQIVLLGDLFVHKKILTPEQRDQLLAAQERAPTAPASASASASAKPARFEVTLSEDRLHAFITLGEGALPDPAELADALSEANVVFGIDNAAVEALCAGDAPRKVPLLVAQGEPPQPGENAGMEYLFDIHPLKAGLQQDDGTIDFRDRGDLPQVDAGTVIARKVAAVEGRPGQDVHGETIASPDPKDPKPVLGPGCALDADGKTVRAIVDGYPSVSALGNIDVFPEYRVEGDVGFHTGHINFRGHVIVTGTIQSGFRVTCGQLTAEEAEGAVIEAKGDVLIRGGIIKSRIRSGAMITAKYLHNSTVETLGDIIISGEVVDSTVLSSGVFRGDRCTVMGSRVSGKHGVFAKQVGSESALPSRLSIGIDEPVRHEIRRVAAELADKETALAADADAEKELHNRREALEQALAKLAQLQDKIVTRQRELRQVAETSKAASAACQEQLAQLESRSRELEGKLETLFAEQDRVVARIDEVKARKADNLEAFTALSEEADRLEEWVQENPGTPLLKVNRTMFAKTTIIAPHVEQRTEGDRRRVWVEEREVTTESGYTAWDLVQGGQRGQPISANLTESGEEATS